MIIFEDFEEVSNFRILIVEDEILALNQLGKFFKRQFKEVILCENGLDGFLRFKQNFDLNEKFDLIISDINMPKMDGLEMIEKIKEIDQEVETIFLSARNEPEKLIKAINLHVSDYILKPIDLNIIDEKIKKISNELYLKRMYAHQKEQIKNYTKILENEALVIKYDKNGFIKDINESFFNFSGYKKEELIGLNFLEFKHPSTSTDFMENIWNEIIEGDTWQGKTKLLSKDGDDYFLSTKIIPILDFEKKEIKEYASINFLVTQEELKNREKSKSFFKQISQYKTLVSKLQKDNQNLSEAVNTLREQSLSIQSKYSTYEEKIKSLNTQLSHYEQNMLQNNKKEFMKEKGKNEQFERVKKSLSQNEEKYKQLEKEMLLLNKILKEKEDEIKDFKEKTSQGEKRIENLTDLVSNLQNEIETLNSKRTLFPVKNRKSKE